MAWHEAYEFFLLLSVLVSSVLGVAYWIWRRTRTISFPLGIFVLYFWSFHGAWAVVHDLHTNSVSGRYQYLYERMFPVHLDGDYLYALVLYWLFVMAVAVAVLLFVRPASRVSLQPGDALRIRHSYLLVISAVAFVGSAFIIRHQLLQVALANRSGYDLTSQGAEVVPLFSLHQSLNRLTVMPLAIGIPLLFTPSSSRFLAASATPAVKGAYALIVVAVFAYGFLLGNKAELFAAMLSGVVIYVLNCGKPNYKGMALGALVMFGGIAITDYIRTVPVGDVLDGQVDTGRLVKAPLEILSSNEAYATHFSMYGVLHHQMPHTYGKGVLSTIAAFVPRFLWKDRPPLTYNYYAEQLGLPETQGFTLHHATGWYINFGAAGVLMGGGLLGAVWVWLFRRFQVGGALAIVGLIGFAFVTGGLADFVRAGIASYKSLALYNVVFPLGVVWLASGADTWWGLPLRPLNGKAMTH